MRRSNITFPIYQAHPWHGIPPGDQFPEVVNAFIEILPSDTVKYELDKQSGYCKIDRLQKYSNILPVLYGFVPGTYCGDQVAKLAGTPAGGETMMGDSDPLDICVLTERPISRGGILVEAIPIGGLRLIDDKEVDDKIIAILKQDDFYGTFKDVDDLPDSLLDRIKHYFLTYKQLPHQPAITRISSVYDKKMAKTVLESSLMDYRQLISTANQS